MYTFVVMFCFILGAVVGSFLNVVILRYPDNKLTGRSYCLSCGKKLSVFELVPVLSYVFLLGRCSKCKVRFSMQYPLVELFMGLVGGWLSYSFFGGEIGLTEAVFDFLILSLLLVLLVIDLRTFILPDIYILLLAVAVLIYGLIHDVDLISGFSGAVLGAGVLWAIRYAWWLMTRQEGVGLGDVKLMIPLGFLFGPVGTSVLLYCAFMVGGIYGFVLLATRKAGMKTAVPFGPFLAGAGMVFVLFPGLPAMILELIM